MIFGPDGRVMAQAYRELPQVFPQPGWVEHDPEAIWQGALACMDEALRQVGPGAVGALGITNQRETTVVWDAATGEPIHNAIVWQCRRTADACARLKPREAEVRQKTGLVLDPYFSATKLAWILEQVPGARARAKAGGLKFGTVDSWVLHKLTAGARHATDPSNASRTLLYSLRTGRWDADLLDLFGVDASLLPAVLPSDARFGEVAAGLPGAGLPITGVLGDQQASLFAHGGWRRGVLKATFGTGIFLMTATGGEAPLVDGLLTTEAWRRGGADVFALEGSIFMGGATLQWLRDGLGVLERAADSQALAESLPDNGGVYFVPAFQGLGAPHWDAQARGLVAGLSRQSGRAHIVRAALEAQAYQVREVVDLMRRAGAAPAELRVDGGACANDFLMRFTADLLGVPVRRPAMAEATALGAAAMAGASAGLWNLEDSLAAQQAGRVFEPSMPRAEADRLFGRWAEAVRRCRQWEPPN